MNGVSRFLSRRDKHHHEKRQAKLDSKNESKHESKHARTKVRSPFSPSPIPSPPKVCSIDGAESQMAQSRRRRTTDSLQSLCHKLPSILRSSVDELLFLDKTPLCAHLSPFHVQVSTIPSSDHITLQSHTVPSDLYAIISNEDAKLEKDDDKKVKALLLRLHSAGITSLGEPQAQYAVSKFPDSLDQAFDLLLLVNDSFEGILREYKPDVKLLGAVNRNMTTCYLDALLFAMFARLDSFEAMLFDHFTDEPRKKLAACLRLWVNLLRTGRLITVDLTKHLQDAIAQCGWEGAAEVCQQDASEAFTFITDALELPLLTLKMDIYHTGREEKEDDHKFVNERLLEVAIPEQDPEEEEDKVITLEACLETYFNNKIEVKRFLQRQNTIGSIKIGESKEIGKGETVHVETIEIPEASSPLVSTPTSLAPVSPITPITPNRPTVNRRRGDSIFSERYKLPPDTTTPPKAFDEKRLLNEMLDASSAGRPRSASLRKEVMMPAWQFFSLIPWYTDNAPKTDAQVAAHFSAQRPVLGICLKRYMMQLDGRPKRLDTFIDIPLEIGLPHFVSDDRMEDEGPLFGNFKLVLQSVVCHRGVSLDSGHYISLVRANLPPNNHHQDPLTSEGEPIGDSWLRFDDLAPERVTTVNMERALREESPYLLFYQVQPIDEELATRGDPPSYVEAHAGSLPADPSKETLSSMMSAATATDTETGEWDRVTATDITPLDSSNSDEPKPRLSTSSDRQSNVAYEELEGSVASLSQGRTAPPTPVEEKSSHLSTSRRGSQNARTPGPSKSRPSSQNGESRLSLTLSRLTGRGSKDKLHISDPASEDPVIVINEVKSAENGAGALKEREEKGKDKKRMRSKSRERRDGDGKGRPERECVVM
ncbi:cysteine proteinase [Lophiostoma macrostomum CBS 122681]|uniref:ubiquitinyl hydrolase 1 n=1 Tax=Lophiostoma macrostomum CBS 122681 TaxID=1314788 RepID=A0A6A6TDS3_9PLEO|nr:cysteine proteinase [Lophiostoma macrostomum CBS 122681]